MTCTFKYNIIIICRDLLSNIMYPFGVLEKHVDLIVNS